VRSLGFQPAVPVSLEMSDESLFACFSAWGAIVFVRFQLGEQLFLFVFGLGSDCFCPFLACGVIAPQAGEMKFEEWLVERCKLLIYSVMMAKMQMIPVLPLLGLLV